jgi:cell division transport system permease protein
MRARFVLAELGNGIRRNLTMTIAVIVTVAISLALFGAGLLIRAQVNAMKDYWYDKVEVSVFLCATESTASTCHGAVTPGQRDAIKTELTRMPEVKRVYYESQQMAFQRFKEQFKDSPDLVRAVTPESLPESFRVKLVDPRQYQVVTDAVAAKPGVEQVQDERRLLDRFFKVLNGFQVAALVVAAVQVMAAVLLIGNTIRVAAYSRRRETGIMRLVGASKFYIQLPFLLEGAFAGLVGALIAVGALSLFKWQFVDERLRKSIPLIRFIGWDAVIGIIPTLVLLGVLLAALASFVSLRRYLRV